jgi:hypothetical protein
LKPLPHFRWQWASQVLVAVPLFAPSSHRSPALSTPSPHDDSGTKLLQSAVQEPGWPLFTPSSQVSPNWPSTALSPQ